MVGYAFFMSLWLLIGRFATEIMIKIELMLLWSLWVVIMGTVGYFAL